MITFHDLAVSDEVIYYEGGRKRMARVTRLTPATIEAEPLTRTGAVWGSASRFWKKNGFEVGEHHTAKILLSTPEKKKAVIEDMEADEIRKAFSGINWQGVKLPTLHAIQALFSKGEP